MKIALACHSLLLEKALKLFLQPYIVTLKQCDFVVCDHEATLEKPLFRVGPHKSDVGFPFSKTSLMLALKAFDSTIKKENRGVSSTVSSTPTQSFALLEEQLESITKRYHAELIAAIKAHYET